MTEENKYKFRKWEGLFNTYITYRTDEYNKEVIMEEMYFIPEYYNCFLLLLKKSINELIKEGFKTFIQLVSKNDYDKFLSNNKNWKIVYIKDDNIYVSCLIERAVEYIGKGLGIYEFSTEY
jgi:hypothetical protein